MEKVLEIIIDLIHKINDRVDYKMNIGKDVIDVTEYKLQDIENKVLTKKTK